MVAVFIVKPDRAVLRAHRSNQRFTIGRHGHPFLGSRPKGDLFRFAAGKTHPPDVKFIAGRVEIQPFSVRRPRAGNAGLINRADQSRRPGLRKRNHATGDQLAAAAHFHHQHVFPVRRKIGMMGHAAIAFRHVYVAALSARFIGGNQGHLQALLDLREEHAATAVDPG